jgi:dTDP-glucose 4,6-dehydratase
MRLNDGRAIPTFLRQALQGEEITVFGDGSQTRSFCFISDLVEGIGRLLLSDHPGPVNLGNPQEMTLRELAETVLRLTQSRSRIVYRPLPEDDPRVRQPDISLAQAALGWSPRVGLEEGLTRTLEDFRARLGARTP